MADAATSRQPSFAALRSPGYRNYWLPMMLAATGDSIEHVVSYWVIFEKFNSPTLGGVAVLTHWLPFLFLSVYAGSLTDRIAPRRLIQISQALMMLVSLGWAATILTDTLTEWSAVLLLTFHGLFGVFAMPSMQLVVHEMVSPGQLQSAVRMNSSARQLGLLLGPAIGGGLMLVVSPVTALLVNALFYLPIVIWCALTDYGAKRESTGKRSGGFQEVRNTLRQVAGDRVIISMIALAGASALFIGNAYQPQMPEFAHELGHHHEEHHAGVFYSLLLSADAIGAITAVLVLESRGLLNAHPRTAIVLVILWCAALTGFAATTMYPVALALMFAAGFLSLAFNAMAQTLVQLRSPPELRGRVVGVYATASFGLRAFSGVTIGVVGGLIGIHWSLAASAMALAATALAILALSMKR